MSSHGDGDSSSAAKKQLQYLRRNLKHVDGLLDEWPPGTPIPLLYWPLHRYWALPHLYQHQLALRSLYRNRQAR